jgi:hypothetical protein
MRCNAKQNMQHNTDANAIQTQVMYEDATDFSKEGRADAAKKKARNFRRELRRKRREGGAQGESEAAKAEAVNAELGRGRPPFHPANAHNMGVAMGASYYDGD